VSFQVLKTASIKAVLFCDAAWQILTDVTEAFATSIIRAMRLPDISE
jgi:hypothetical protein